VKRNADFKQIVSVLRRFRVSACPVINDAGHVVGVVSEADLLYKEASGRKPAGLIRLRWRLGEQSKAAAVTAGRLMTSPPITIHPDTSVAVAARMMQDRWVKRLPVVGDDGLLIGIVTRSDVLSVYERPDDDILTEILTDVIVAEFGLAASTFDVCVASGIVAISGLMEQAGAALALVARLRRIEGVVAVRDRLNIGQRGIGRPSGSQHSGSQDGVGQDGVGQDGVGQDGVGQDGVGQDSVGQDSVGQDGVGQHGVPRQRGALAGDSDPAAGHLTRR
jgi:CBS domain-containing protein